VRDVRQEALQALRARATQRQALVHGVRLREQRGGAMTITECADCSNFERSPYDKAGGWCLQWSAEVPEDGWCHMAEQAADGCRCHVDEAGRNVGNGNGCRDRYALRCGVEAEDVIAEVMRNASERGLSMQQCWDVGNATKYLLRLGRKDDMERELRKSENYLHHALTGEWL
jgi:hypothetical protein